MHVLITCKYKKDRIKNNQEKVATLFFPLQVNGGFLLPWKPEFLSNLSHQKFELVQDFMHVLVTCKYKKDWIKNQLIKGGDIVFPIKSQRGLPVAMETRDFIQSVPKPYAAFRPPQ